MTDVAAHSHAYNSVNCRGNTDMLLLLLNDDKNSVIRQGIDIINSRAAGHGVLEGKEGDSVADRH